MARALSLLMLACILTGALGDDDWQSHPGWALLREDKVAEAQRAFAASLAELSGAEQAEGLQLGWTVSLAAVATDMLREIAQFAPGTDAGDRAAQLLMMLGQEDRSACRSWADDGLPPWKEALVRLLDMYPVGDADFLISPPRLVIARDGTEFRWEGGSFRRHPLSAVVVAQPGQEAVRVLVPEGAVDTRDLRDSHEIYNGCHMALSPDGTRLYLASWLTVRCLDASALRKGQLVELWRFVPPKASRTSTSVAVTSDGATVIWANREAGIGLLYALSGEPLAHSKQLEALPQSGVNVGISLDGATFCLPMILAAEESDTPLPAGGEYRSLSRKSEYCRPSVWLLLDAASGAVKGQAENPWAPVEARSGPTRSTRWGYSHTPPDWCRSTPDGSAFCVVSTGSDQGRLVLVDLAGLEIIGQTRTATGDEGGHFRQAASGAGLGSFAEPLEILVTEEEHSSVREFFDLVRTQQDGLSLALDQAGESPSKRLLAAFGLLAATSALPDLGVPKRPVRRVLGGADADAELFPRDDPTTPLRYDERVAAWRALWDAYLRHPRVGLLGEPEEDGDAQDGQPLVAEPVSLADHLKLPVRFKPSGVSISADGKWLYAGDHKGRPCWVSTRTGRHAFRIHSGAPIWDLASMPGSDDVMVVHGGGVYNAHLLDMRRGRTTGSYSLLTSTKVAPVGPARWLVITNSGEPLVLNSETGVVEDAYASPWVKGVPVSPRGDGCLGFAEDGSYLLIPCEAQSGQGEEITRVPGWARFSLTEGAFTGLLGVPDVLTTDGWAALQGLQPDAKGKRPAVFVPASMFPWSQEKWVIGSRGGMHLAGAQRTVAVHRVTVGRGAGTGGLGGVTTIRY